MRGDGTLEKANVKAFEPADSRLCVHLCELAQLDAAVLKLMLPASKGHPLSKVRKLRLRDLSDAAIFYPGPL